MAADPRRSHGVARQSPSSAQLSAQQEGGPLNWPMHTTLDNPGWGPRTLLFKLEAAGVDPLPGRSSLYRCLVRHGLIEPAARRRKKADCKRWERLRAMELWQMDVVGGVMLADGWKASIVSGIDDHSRFVVSAHVVRRATARPVCDALSKAMRSHGVPSVFAFGPDSVVSRW